MIARHVSLETHEAVEAEIASEQDLIDVFSQVFGQAGDRGVPAIEFSQEDGSALVVAHTGRGEVLLWMSADGASMHSVGPIDEEATVVFDYMGSYTQVPMRYVVAARFGLAASVAMLTGASPNIPGLTWERD